jgi:hypothetical protein
MRTLAVLLVVGVAGCATGAGVFEEHLAAQAEAEQACARWYQALDRAIDDAGVRDAQYAPVPGFPYLRADRFAASTRDQAGASDAAMRVFAERLLELDLALGQQRLPQGIEARPLQHAGHRKAR